MNAVSKGNASPRPAGTGERLGFPSRVTCSRSGSPASNNYLYDALHSLLEPTATTGCLERGVIEVGRRWPYHSAGRNWPENAFVRSRVADRSTEHARPAPACGMRASPHLPRLGENSADECDMADPAQVELACPGQCLSEAARVPTGVEGVALCT